MAAGCRQLGCLLRQQLRLAQPGAFRQPLRCLGQQIEAEVAGFAFQCVRQPVQLVRIGRLRLCFDCRGAVPMLLGKACQQPPVQCQIAMQACQRLMHRYVGQLRHQRGDVGCTGSRRLGIAVAIVA